MTNNNKQVVMAIFCYVYYNNYVSPATTGVSAVMSAALKLPPLQQVGAGRWPPGASTGAAVRRRAPWYRPLAAALQLLAPGGGRVLRAGRLLPPPPRDWTWTVCHMLPGPRCSHASPPTASPPPRSPNATAPQLELLERLSNVLVGHEMLPARLGGAIADHAGRALAGGG